jgi:hypothetical protein
MSDKLKICHACLSLFHVNCNITFLIFCISKMKGLQNQNANVIQYTLLQEMIKYKFYVMLFSVQAASVKF